MASGTRRIPAGPVEKYSNTEDLLVWLGEQSAQFGDIFRASIYGADVYFLNAPTYIEHVLLKNWQNYPKGQAIKRIALLLGNGLMVSKGDLWMRQRRMLQPAFNRAALGNLTGVITDANTGLLEKWKRAALAKQSVNVTRDISLMILDIVLKSIFGDDHDEVEPQFRLVSEEAARNLEFAVVFTSLAKIILTLAQRRRKENRTSDDFLGKLMQARDRDSGEGMSDSQLTKEIMTLIVAGHETTASTLNWVWYLLSQNPKADAKLSDELNRLLKGDVPSVDSLKEFTYTQFVIEEALRLYPPGWLMTRRAVRDDEIGEYFVPAGTEILHLALLHPTPSEALGVAGQLRAGPFRAGGARPAPVGNDSILGGPEKLHRGAPRQDRDADSPHDDSEALAAALRRKNKPDLGCGSEFC